MPHKLSLAIFSTSHLVVDLACFYVLMGAFSAEVVDLQLIAIGFLLYNAVAFALQVFIGLAADYSRISHGYIAALGCLLVIVGVVLPAMPWLRLILCALGNACFHVGGGIDSLVNAGGRLARNGFFIAFGALGVAFGTLAGRSGMGLGWLIALALAACTVLILKFCRERFSNYQVDIDLPPAKIKLGELAICLCLASIVVRAVIGSYTPLPWRGTEMLFLLPALAAFTGKLSGGFLADWLGARPTATIALALSAPLLAFGNTSVILSCIGLILFNTTTAVTLGAIAAQLPRHPGFGFGLTTLGLFIGSTFSFFWALPEYLRPSLTLVLIAISAIFILLAVPGKAIRKPEAAKKTSGNARIKTRQ